MKFKVIQEYKTYYLAQNEKGYKECFDKPKYKPTEDGYIIKRKEKNYLGGISLSPEKVNRNFNYSVPFKN